MTMRMLLILRFVIQDLYYDWSRSLLNLIKLIVMVSCYLLVAVLGQAFQVFSTGMAASAYNLLIASDPILDPADSSLPLGLLDQAVLAVQAEFGVQAIKASAPVQFLHLNLEKQIFQVLAVPENSFEPVFQLKLVAGNWPRERGQVMVSRGAAQSAGWRIGQTLEIYGHPFVLCGIIDSTSRGTASLWMSLPDGEQVFGSQHGIQFGILQINPQANLTAIQAWLEASPLLEGQYAVYQESQLSEVLNRALRGMQPLAELFRWMALLVLVFGGFNVASLTLLERQTELTLLQRIGFPSKVIQGFVLYRTALITLLAYPCGWTAAWLLQQLQPGGLVIYGANLNLAFYNQTAWLGLVLALLSTLLGAWLAVRNSVETEL